MSTATAPIKTSAFLQLEEDLQQAKSKHATFYVFSPINDEVIEGFGKQLPAGRITAIRGHELVKHYNLGEFSEDMQKLIKEGRFTLRQTSTPGLYYDHIATMEVIPGFVTSNADYGMVELTHLRGGEYDVDGLNDLFFPATDDVIDAPFANGTYTEAIGGVRELLKSKDAAIRQSAQLLAASMETAARYAQAVVQVATARLATPGNQIPLDSREEKCFAYLGTPTPGFGAPVQAAPQAVTVKVDNSALEAQLAAQQRELDELKAMLRKQSQPQPAQSQPARKN